MNRATMKIVLFGVGLCALLACVFAIVHIHFLTPSKPPHYTVAPLEYPAVSAASWVVFDVESGEELLASAADEPRPIASITKLPLAVSVLRETSRLATTSINARALSTAGHSGELQLGAEYSYQELVTASLLTSANDATAALFQAEPALLVQMNQTAADLALVNTHFVGPSGLLAGNVSTARELSILVRHFHQTTPEVFDITRLSAFYTGDTNNGWLNNNPFRADSQYRGGKHGFTYAANRTAVALFAESVSEKERLLGYVLLGSDDLALDMEQLRDYVARSVRYE